MGEKKSDPLPALFHTIINQVVCKNKGEKNGSLGGARTHAAPVYLDDDDALLQLAVEDGAQIGHARLPHFLRLELGCCRWHGIAIGKRRVAHVGTAFFMFSQVGMQQKKASGPVGFFF